MADLKDFAEQLVSLSVKDVNELATILKDDYGIEPAAAAVAVAGPAAGGGTAFSIVSTASVAADSSLVALDKSTAIYLEEDMSITVTAGTANDLEVIVSYEEIS